MGPNQQAQSYKMDKRHRNLLMNWSSLQSAKWLVTFCQPGTTRGFILDLTQTDDQHRSRLALLAISNQHTKSQRFAPISKWGSASDTQQPETTRGSISSHANKTSSALAPKSIWGSILSTFKATQIFSNQQLCTHHQQPKTSQKLRMLSIVTLNCQITKIVMNSGSQLSEL